MRNLHNANKKHISILEIMISLSILTIFVGFCIPNVKNFKRNSEINNMLLDIEILNKVINIFNTNNKDLPIISHNIVEIDDVSESLKENLRMKNDREEELYKIDIKKLKNYISDLNYGYEQDNKDFYIYSKKTGNIYYYKGLLNTDNMFQHS